MSPRNVLHKSYNTHPTYPKLFDTQFDTNYGLNASESKAMSMNAFVMNPFISSTVWGFSRKNDYCVTVHLLLAHPVFFESKPILDSMSWTYNVAYGEMLWCCRCVQHNISLYCVTSFNTSQKDFLKIIVHWSSQKIILILKYLSQLFLKMSLDVSNILSSKTHILFGIFFLYYITV